MCMGEKPHTDMGNLSGSTLLKKTDSSSPPSHQLSIAPLLGLGFCPHSESTLYCWMVCSSVSLGQSTLSALHSWMQSSSHIQKRVSPQFSLNSGSHSLSTPLLQWALSPELWGEGMQHRGTTFRWLTCTLHFDYLWSSSVLLTRMQLLLMNTNLSQWT